MKFSHRLIALNSVKHNVFSGIQGGDADAGEYYHLTEDEYVGLQRNLNNGGYILKITFDPVFAGESFTITKFAVKPLNLFRGYKAVFFFFVLISSHVI